MEEANKQLSSRQIEEETRERASEYRQDLKATTYDLEHQVRYRLADALLGDILHEFKLLLPALDSESKSLFDGTVCYEKSGQGVARMWRMRHLPLCKLCGLGNAQRLQKPRRRRWRRPALGAQ